MNYKKIISSLLLCCLFFSTLGQNYLEAFNKKTADLQLRPPHQTINLSYQPEIKIIKSVVVHYKRPLLAGSIVSFFALTGLAGSAAAYQTTIALGIPIIRWLAVGVILLILANNLFSFIANKKKWDITGYWWFVPIRIRWHWPIGFAVFSALGAGTYGWGTSMSLIITAYGMILLHELAHVFMGNISRAERYFFEIRLGIYGAMGLIDKTKETPDAITEFINTIVGPLMNLTLFMIFITWSKQLDDQILKNVAIINYILMVVNCIPAYPLDGGKMLKACLRMLGENKYLGYKMSAIVADLWATDKALKIGGPVRQLLVILGIVWFYYIPQAIGTIIAILLIPIVFSWILSLLEKTALKERILSLQETNPNDYKKINDYLQRQTSQKTSLSL